jgi:lipopolysaccharide export system permease protein
MSQFRILDRYVLKSWTRLFIVTALGFPIVAVLTEAVQELTNLLNRGLAVKQIAVSYIFGIPAWASLVMPAAVLFATIFTVGGMARHSEITAAKAGGLSFHRMVLPLLAAALAAAGLAVIVGELAVRSTEKMTTMQRDPRIQTTASRFNFVYRADQGWVYAVRSLDVASSTLRELIFERQGTGPDYPTLVIRADSATWSDSTATWRLWNGESRLVAGTPPARNASIAFESLELAAMTQEPRDLLAEAKAPAAMQYAELGRYIEAMRRAGNETGKLEVQRAQRISVPAACLVIALFGAPLAMAAPRSGSAFGLGVSLAATVVYLLLAQIALAMGDSRIVDPGLLAWMPNVVFLLAGLVLLNRVRT